MATIKDTAATNALNEEDYINKLYDQMQDRQKQLLVDAYSENTVALDTAQQEVQKQTDTNLERTDVEAQKTQQGYKPANVSNGINQQTALAMGNQQRKNVSTLRDAQAEADAEIERRRLLLGQQYAKAIEQARADNDMLRAEQLYKEAQDRDAQIRALQTEAGQLLAAQGDNSVLEALLDGGSIDTSATGETWSDALKNEGTINQIYDSANESAQLQAEATTEAILSQIRDQQEQQKKESDRKLTETYVNALRQGKNYDEVQGAYGLGSGNKAQARLARALGTTEDMTALRGVQTGANAAALQKIAAAIQDRNAKVTDAVSDNELKRIQALYDAAENEEQALIDTQRTVGKTLAEQGDFSVLGKLYGLTQDQIDRLQGTGAYAPVEEPEQETNNTGSSGENSGYEKLLEEEEEDEEPVVPAETVSRGQQSVLDLGSGPISNEGLADMVEKGEVLEVPTASGPIYVPQTGNPTLDLNAIRSAAVEAAKKNDAEAVEAFKNMNMVFANAGANAEEETLIDKIGDFVSEFPIVGPVGTKIGEMIANAYVNAYDKATSPTAKSEQKNYNTSTSSRSGVARNIVKKQTNANSTSVKKDVVDAVTSASPSTGSSKANNESGILESIANAFKDYLKYNATPTSTSSSKKKTTGTAKR